MPEVSYVYPNLSQFHRKSTAQRGGLTERWKLAQETGCSYIEVPGTMIKNKTEEELSGLEIGDFLTEKEIELFYKQEAQLPKELKYIIHTEPSLSKTNRYGRKIQPEIKWYNKEWTQQHIEMILKICSHLKKPADVIEIHPGYQKNTYDDIASAISNLLESYSDAFGFYPIILLENRTEQFISRASDIKEYWRHLETNHLDLVKQTGIVLDVQQLHTREKGNFLKKYAEIPDECLKGFHIHTRHRRPMLSDRIPWRFVFGKIRELEGSIIINPEIHQRNWVKHSIEFCKTMLQS